MRFRRQRIDGAGPRRDLIQWNRRNFDAKIPAYGF